MFEVLFDGELLCVILSFKYISIGTSIYSACQEGHSHIVKHLLKVSDKNPEHAIDLNKKTIDGAMAVHFSVRSKVNFIYFKSANQQRINC